MKDKLIDFETAKLAKEKRFNWLSYFYYMENNPTAVEEAFNKNNPWDFNFKDEYNTTSFKSITAPTQSILQKWLREEYSIQMVIKPWYDPELFEFQFTCDVFGTEFTNYIKSHRHDTYEEALEEGLVNALNLIKQ